MRIAYYLTFLFTLYVAEQILIDYPGKGQAWLFDTIIFTFLGILVVAYAVFLYLSWREKNPGRKYPSTVQARLREGIRRGATKKP